MANWKEKIKKDCENIIKENNLGKVNFSPTLITIFLCIIPIFIVGAIALIIVEMINIFKKLNWNHYVFIGLIVGCFAVFSLLFWWINKLEKNPIRDKFINALDFSSYYQSAFEETANEKYHFSNLTTKFEIEPCDFLPFDGIGSVWCEKILNFSCDNVQYSYGTLLKEVVTKTYTSGIKTSTDHKYTRFVYLNLCLKQSTNLQANICPSKSFLKINRIPDNVDLESVEFEKLFAVIANNQILIRKILKPTVINELVKLALKCRGKNEKKKTPKIAINNDVITLAFPSFSVVDPSSPIDLLGGVNFECKAIKIAEQICKKIKDDIDLLWKRLEWVDAFNFN